MSDTTHEMFTTYAHCYCDPGAMDFRVRVTRAPKAATMDFEVSSFAPGEEDKAQLLFVGRNMRCDPGKPIASFATLRTVRDSVGDRALWDATRDRETFWAKYFAEFCDALEDEQEENYNALNRWTDRRVREKDQEAQTLESLVEALRAQIFDKDVLIDELRAELAELKELRAQG